MREKQELRHEQKEAKWCLQDGSRARLPVISAFEATDLALKLAGAAVSSRLYVCAVACTIAEDGVRARTASQARHDLDRATLATLSFQILEHAHTQSTP